MCSSSLITTASYPSYPMTSHTDQKPILYKNRCITHQNNYYPQPNMYTKWEVSQYASVLCATITGYHSALPLGCLGNMNHEWTTNILAQ